MFKLNNKGQSLVMFIVIIPIFLILITLIYDVGNALYVRSNLSNTCYMVIDYGLDNIDNISENDLIDLIEKNSGVLDLISVNVEENYIEVMLEKNVKGIIGNLFGFDLIQVPAHYNGENVNGIKKIERVK